MGPIPIAGSHLGATFAHCLLTFNWLEEFDMPTLHISDCLASWLHHLGMRTAFTSATPFKCLHLDRGYLIHEEALKIPEIQFEEVIQIPIFDGSQLHYSYRPYLVVAILAHFGDRHGGHYVALLHREGQWIEKNDGQQPTYYDELPKYIWQAAVVLFMRLKDGTFLSRQLEELLSMLAD